MNDETSQSPLKELIDALYAEHEYYGSTLPRSRHKCRKAFAQQRGWIMAGRKFSIRMLREGRRKAGRADLQGPDELPTGQAYDHVDYFKTPTKQGRPAAFVTHSYRPVELILEQAERDGLQAQVLERSWYNPMATAVVLTPK